jgi:hypothetical protein
MTIPIDLSKIRWVSGEIEQFEVSGKGSVQQLLAADPTTEVVITRQAQLGFDVAANTVGVQIRIGYTVAAGESSPPTDISGRFVLDFIFTVDNLLELLIEEKGQPASAVHPQLVLLLTSVAYSTARGILWTRLAGTALEGVTLPLIDPRELFQPAAPASVSE